MIFEKKTIENEIAIVVNENTLVFKQETRVKPELKWWRTKGRGERAAWPQER